MVGEGRLQLDYFSYSDFDTPSELYVSIMQKFNYPTPNFCFAHAYRRLPSIDMRAVSFSEALKALSYYIDVAGIYDIRRKTHYVGLRKALFRKMRGRTGVAQPVFFRTSIFGMQPFGCGCRKKSSVCKRLSSVIPYKSRGA